MLDDSKYRKGVGLILLNKDNKVFVGQRFDSSVEAWQMPQGGIDKDEEPIKAMYREAMEEIGTNNFEVIAENQGWLYYDLPENLRAVLWNGQYIGQMQKWYLLKFLGNDSDINIATDEPEFKDWRWVAPSELPNIIVEFKRDLYSKLLEIFGEYLSK